MQLSQCSIDTHLQSSDAWINLITSFSKICLHLKCKVECITNITVVYLYWKWCHKSPLTYRFVYLSNFSAALTFFILDIGCYTSSSDTMVNCKHSTSTHCLTLSTDFTWIFYLCFTAHTFDWSLLPFVCQSCSTCDGRPRLHQSPRSPLCVCLVLDVLLKSYSS